MITNIYEYEGELWGFVMVDDSVICRDCFEKKFKGQKDITRALGTEDTDPDDPNKHYLYQCEECGNVSY